MISRPAVTADLYGHFEAGKELNLPRAIGLISPSPPPGGDNRIRTLSNDVPHTSQPE